MLKLPKLHEQITHWRQFWRLNQSREIGANRQLVVNSELWLRPQPLGTVRLEAIRLNELLAKPSGYRCRNRRKTTIIGGKKDIFFICHKPEFSLNGKTGMPQLQQKPNVCEKALLIRVVRKDVRLNYVELARHGDNHSMGRSTKLRIGLIKLEKPQKLEKENKQKIIEQIEWEIQRLKFRHLFLVLRPAADRDGAGALLFHWYRFIIKLFFKWHFAILAEAVAKHYKIEDIPCHGLGSPFEEKLRFVHFLLAGTNKNYSALRIDGDFSSSNLPILCSISYKSNFYKIVFVRHGLIEKITILSTAKLKRDLDEENFNFTMSSKFIGAFMDEIQQNESDQSKVLLLDLDGFEWELLEAIGDFEHCAKWPKAFEQISLRLRLWAMEESENWRRFYLLLLRKFNLMVEFAC
uniref:Methyltransferase FkbM domain-containing protein n=1 Tax=Globodera rostochiensis TaxID=31243 RepID=A0A914I339_GLORO